MASSRIVRTLRRGCHGDCQVLVHLDDSGQPVKITGDPDRLRYPLRRTGRRREGGFGRIDHDFVRDWCIGFEALAEHVGSFSPEWAEPIKCGLYRIEAA